MRTKYTHARVKGCNNEEGGLTKLTHKPLKTMDITSEKAHSIIHNNEPSFEINGVEVYLTSNQVSEFMLKATRSWMADKTSFEEFAAHTAVYFDGEEIAVAPFIITKSGITADANLTSHFAEDALEVGAEVDNPDENMVATFEMVTRLTEDNPQEDFEGDFSDKEIQGIAEAMMDAGVVGEECVQIDGSGINVREPAQWLAAEAEKQSDPFEVNGVEYMAFSGRGYTAVIRLLDRRNYGGGDIKSQEISENVTVHKVTGKVATNFV